jgi:hypothetical protein
VATDSEARRAVELNRTRRPELRERLHRRQSKPDPPASERIVDEAIARTKAEIDKCTQNIRCTAAFRRNACRFCQHHRGEIKDVVPRPVEVLRHRLVRPGVDLAGEPAALLMDDIDGADNIRPASTIRGVRARCPAPFPPDSLVVAIEPVAPVGSTVPKPRRVAGSCRLQPRRRGRGRGSTRPGEAESDWKRCTFRRWTTPQTSVG